MKLLTAIECPGLSTGLPSLKRPMRGPRKMAATRAQVPPKKCTTPLPAMSMKPISFNQPSSAHAHRDTTGYTKPAVFLLDSYNIRYLNILVVEITQKSLNKSILLVIEEKPCRYLFCIVTKLKIK